MFFWDETFEEFVQSLLTKPRYFETATLCCRKRRDHHASTNCGVQGHPDHFLPWERIDTWNRMTEQSLRSRDLLEKGLVVRKLLVNKRGENGIQGGFGTRVRKLRKAVEKLIQYGLVHKVAAKFVPVKDRLPRHRGQCPRRSTQPFVVASRN